MKITTIAVDELIEIINVSINNAFTQIPEKSQDDVLLKRKDVAKLFSISLVTLNEWMRTDRLPYHRINSRIFFKKSEIFEALNSTKKYQHK